MKRFWFGLLILVLTGCGIAEDKSGSFPSYIILQNSDGRVIGAATEIEANVFVTADHLLEKSKSLFHEGQKVQILGRDFEHDLMVFSLGIPRLKSWVNEHNILVNEGQVGDKVFWFDGEQFREESILSVLEDFIIEDHVKKNLMVLSGIISPGDSGMPVFNNEGGIQGILIGADKAENISFAVSADIILQFITENIDERVNYP